MTNKSDQTEKKDWQALAEQVQQADVEEAIEHEEGQQDQPADQSAKKSDINIDELKQQLEEAQAKAADHWELVLRTRAEQQNLERRSRDELEKARKYEVGRFVNELLPILDSLEHALLACTEASDSIAVLKQGVEMTLKMFISVLDKFAIKPIDPTGQAFDPSFHEAMSMQEDGTVPPNTVIHVMQKGYMLHDRVLRPARVIVSKASSIS